MRVAFAFIVLIIIMFECPYKFTLPFPGLCDQLSNLPLRRDKSGLTPVLAEEFRKKLFLVS